METASIQIGFEYDSEDWKLDIEVIKADIIPADENKEKEGNSVFIASTVCIVFSFVIIHCL